MGWAVAVLPRQRLAEEHYDVELQNNAGKGAGPGRLAEGLAGITKLHAMIGEHDDEGRVIVGIETGRGPWVQALVAAGYRVMNQSQIAAEVGLSQMHVSRVLRQILARLRAAMPG